MEGGSARSGSRRFRGSGSPGRRFDDIGHRQVTGKKRGEGSHVEDQPALVVRADRLDAFARLAAGEKDGQRFPRSGAKAET